MHSNAETIAQMKHDGLAMECPECDGFGKKIGRDEFGRRQLVECWFCCEWGVI